VNVPQPQKKKEISYSNPPAVNRKIGLDNQGGVGPAGIDSFSIDVSSIHNYRDSSQKNKEVAKRKTADVINVP
jgi:hypothetical protein